jgi:hypothetical protein
MFSSARSGGAAVRWEYAVAAIKAQTATAASSKRWIVDLIVFSCDFLDLFRYNL